MSDSVLLQGDCLEVLKDLPDNSIDSLCCDPPAGIAFMGKSWDEDKGGRKQWISWMTQVMAEYLRVLKPGAHGLVWALPRTSHWTATALEDAGFEIRDSIEHIFGSGFPKSHNIEKATEDSRFAGVGTALKPAHETWWLVRKPCSEDTVAANVLLHGTGGINIDASRIAGKLEGDPNRFSKAYSMGDGHEGWKRPSHENYTPPVVRTEGRFPANLIFSHSPGCVDECEEGCTVAELDRQSGISKSMVGSGGASRFFYVAKASKSDKGLENTHPTVKSTKLMQYLINMITPPKGVVLDPFMGSGSTGVAAVKNAFAFVGIEKELEYYTIAEKRITLAERSDNGTVDISQDDSAA